MNRYLAIRLATLPPSRCAREVDAAELIQRFENHERASEQSARTEAGKRAEPAPRPGPRLFSWSAQ